MLVGCASRVYSLRWVCSKSSTGVRAVGRGCRAPWARAPLPKQPQRRVWKSTAAGEAPAPRLPLAERPPDYSAPLQSIREWRLLAQEAVAAVGDSWAQADGGPSQEDLQTELSWLLDDAVAGVAGEAGINAQATRWRALERESAAQPAAGRVVQLRESLETLGELWRERLQERTPLQYLTSSAYWRDMVLSVGPGVLIPRPETELVLDFVAEAVAAAPELGDGPWADLGTGSGVLAVAVARALPRAPRVYAVDLSPTPAAYAAYNAERLGVGGRVAPVLGSWYEPLRALGVGPLAGIVSNPPYIAAPVLPGLQAEVGRHEPRLALDGGDGLGIDALMPICTGAVGMLAPGGFLALETGGGEQAAYVASVLSCMRSDAGAWTGGGGGGGAGGPAFVNVRVRRDLAGVDRFVTASRAGAGG